MTGKIRKGIVFKKEGKNNFLELEPRSLSTYLSALPKNKKGWVRFLIIENPEPLFNGFSHRVLPDQSTSLHSGRSFEEMETK